MANHLTRPQKQTKNVGQKNFFFSISCWISASESFWTDKSEKKEEGLHFCVQIVFSSRSSLISVSWSFKPEQLIQKNILIPIYKYFIILFVTMIKNLLQMCFAKLSILIFPHCHYWLLFLHPSLQWSYFVVGRTTNNLLSHWKLSIKVFNYGKTSEILNQDRGGMDSTTFSA